MMIKNTLMPRLLAAALAVTPLTLAAADEAPATKVRVEQAQLQEVAEHIWVPGTVVSRHDARVATEVSGRIRWTAEIGQSFKQGDVLVKLEDELIRLTLMDDQANVKRLSARVGLLKKQLKRLQRIADSTAKDDVDEKSAALAMAEQELAQAEIAVRRARYQLSLTQVKAPFDGTVVERIQQVGEYSQQGSDVLRIVDMNHLEVRVAAPLSAASHVAAGMAVDVRDRRREVVMPVRTLVPVGDDRSRMMELRIDLEPGHWPVGSAVRVGLPNSESHQALTVHRDALVLRKDQIYLFVVDEEHQARRVDVTLGIGFKQFIVVTGELTAGDQVIVRGAERLRPGQKVDVVQQAIASVR